MSKLETRVMVGLVLAGLCMFSAIGYSDVVFSDNFDGGTIGEVPSGWSNIGTFMVSDQGVDIVALAQGAGTESLTHVLGFAVSDSFTLSFDYDWRWGNGSASNMFSVGLLDASGNGYMVRTLQSDGSGHAGVNTIEILRMDSGTATQLTAGNGYDAAGWKTLALDNPDLKPVELRWDADTNTLSAWYDSGSGMVQTASVVDSTYTSFARVYAWAEQTGEMVFMDNVSLDAVPEPATLSLLVLGGVCLIRRRFV